MKSEHMLICWAKVQPTPWRLLPVPKLSRVIVMVALVFVAACSYNKKSTQQFREAEDLYQDEKYADSVKSLTPLARSGDARAQYALGYMYYTGKGVQQDVTVAKLWIRNAAKQDYAPAKRALAILSNYDGTAVTTKPAQSQNKSQTKNQIKRKTKSVKGVSVSQASLPQPSQGE